MRGTGEHVNCLQAQGLGTRSPSLIPKMKGHLHGRNLPLGDSTQASQGSDLLVLCHGGVTIPSWPSPGAPVCRLSVKVTCAGGGAKCHSCHCQAWALPLRGARRHEEGRAGSGLPSEEGQGCVASLLPPSSLRQGIGLWAGHPTPALKLLPSCLSGGPTAYSKSPSRYLPKAWRTTVLTAMSGFTTQNCRVACWGKRLRVEDKQRNCVTSTSSGQLGLCWRPTGWVWGSSVLP